jgi:hypothetical protein
VLHFFPHRTARLDLDPDVSLNSILLAEHPKEHSSLLFPGNKRALQQRPAIETVIALPGKVDRLG